MLALQKSTTSGCFRVTSLNKRFFSISSQLKKDDSSSSYVEIKDTNRNGLIRRIVMVNDKQRNTLSLDAIKHLQNAIKNTDVDKYRIIVLSAGQRHVFSSGHNLKELTSEDSTIATQVFREMSNLCALLRNSPLPTIAEVYGLAAAGGCQLAASCDLIVASDKASFSTPGVKFGIFCSTPGVAVARNVDSKLALKMLFTGEAINAEEALKHGLISEIVPAEKLESRVDEIAGQINSNSKSVVALGKKCFYKQVEQASLDEAYKIAECTMVDNLKYEDTQNGLKSFAQKKKPVWSHSDKQIA